MATRRLPFLLSFLFLGFTAVNAQVASRIRTSVDPAQTVALPNTTPKLIQGSADLGPLAPTTPMGKLVLVLTPDAAQESAMEALIDDLHLPSSPRYHQWLTPAQVGERFGIAAEDVALVQQWLEASGLTVEQVAKSRRFIVFSGTAAQVGRVFGTEIHSFRNARGSFVANISDVKIPAALQNVVGGVSRLNSEPRSNARVVGPVPIDPVTKQISFSNGLHVLTPGDFSILYNLKPLWAAGVDGTGQTIAIVARSQIDIANIRDFRSWFMPQYTGNDPVIVVNGHDPGELQGDDVETMLDATWSGAVAPKATIKIVVSDSIISDGVDVSSAYIVDTNLAPVMSLSYGLCERSLGYSAVQYYGSLWKQAAAQGITVLVSSGDSGSAGCDNPNDYAPAVHGLGVNGLASSPYNVAVGGTQFDEGATPSQYWGLTSAVDGTSVKSYIPEKVWNESSVDVNNTSIWAGGGGASTSWAKPVWQTGTGVPVDGRRDVPDVSLSASIHDGYALCFQRSCQSNSLYYVGGTSASAPSFAGIMALVNQKTKSIQGNANYILYAMASQSPTAFHDIVNGSNKVPDYTGNYIGFAAAAGYDQASGLGSVDANALVNNWSTVSLSASTVVMTSTKAGQEVTHGTLVPFTVTVTPASGATGTPTGSVTFYAESKAIGSTATLGTSGSGMVVVNAIPVGTHKVTARYSGDGKFLASMSAPIAINVTTREVPYVSFLTSSYFASTQAAYGEPVLIGALVNSPSHSDFPTGSVDFLVGTTKVGSGVLDYADNQGSTGIVTFPAAFPVGSYGMTASYPGDSNFTAATSAAAALSITKNDSRTTLLFGGTVVANVPLPVSGKISLATANSAAPISGTVKFQDVTQTTPVDLSTVTVASNGTYSGTLTFTGTTPALITATYSGDGNINGSYLLRGVTPLAKGTPTLKLVSSSLSVSAGSPVTFTATASSTVAGKVPTGTVTFLDGSTALGTGALDANGIATYTTTLLGGGVHTISASYAGDTVFNTATSTAVTQTVADFALQVTPSSISIKQGTSASAAFVVQPQGGYKQAVSFSCTGLPTNMGCTFTPSSVTPDGVNAVTSTLTITTDGSVHAQNRIPHNGGWMLAAFSGLAFGIIVIPAGSRRRMWIALSLVSILLLAGLLACGGSSTKPTTPTTNSSYVAPGSYTVSVSASATGSAGHQSSLTITVTQ